MIVFKSPLTDINFFVTASPLNMSIEDKMEVDNRSVYVGNVSDQEINSLAVSFCTKL